MYSVVCRQCLRVAPTRRLRKRHTINIARRSFSAAASNMDFLAENNACGQTLLRLVAKGNATIAELLRLKDVIPSVYGKSPSKADAAKYGELIQADFNYFKSTEQFENKVEQSEYLQQLDEELKENHVDLLKRFYRLFESMHRFVTDLTVYIGDLDDGVFIQQSLETVFLDTEGKQLLVRIILKILEMSALHGAHHHFLYTYLGGLYMYNCMCS